MTKELAAELMIGLQTIVLTVSTVKEIATKTVAFLVAGTHTRDTAAFGIETSSS